MRRAARVMATMILLGARPELAAPSAYDQAFVSAFADACIPGRLSYEATQQAAMAAGWMATDFGADPQLAIIETLSADVAEKLEPLKGKMVFAVYAKVIEGAPHYLVTSFADLGPAAANEAVVGCFLYNFAAMASVDPEAVTALLGAPFAESQVDADIASYSWTPPTTLPGTRETYLTFVPASSQYKQQTGFSGQVLQFNTTVTPAQESHS